MIELLSNSILTTNILIICAILLNGLLAVIIIFSPKKEVGIYRWFMFGYALFELLYALTTYLGVPMHFIAERTWIFVSLTGPLLGTRFAFLGSALCCFLYETWMGFMVSNYLYRYIVLCWPYLSFRIKIRKMPKMIICACSFGWLTICAICSTYVCAINKITETMKHRLHDAFDIENTEIIGYTMLRLYDTNGDTSISGIIGTGVHYIAIFACCFCIVFCSYRIWKTIKSLENLRSTANLNLERQLFRTLVLQTSTPLLFVLLPSIFHLSFPFWETNPIGVLSAVFAVSLMITKVLDPIIAIICVSEYRSTLLRFIGFLKTPVGIMDSSTIDERF